MDGISRSRGWDKEIPHGVLRMEQLVLSDKWVRKNDPSLAITDCHQSASLLMPIGDPQDGFFYPILTLIIDTYSIDS